MKIHALILSLFLSFPIFAGTSILSDLDDTIKITQAGEASDILGSDVFLGITEFFKGASNYSNELHILSASPTILRAKIQRTLNKHAIKYKSLTLRSNVLENKLDYKVKAIVKLMEQSKDDFIFLGDDLGQDPEVYAEIKARYPHRVLAIYIHVINGRPIHTDAQLYWTSFDLFLREFIADRMSAGWVEMMASKFLEVSDEDEMELIFPEKAQCPTTPAVWEWQMATVYQPEAFQLVSKLVQFCQQRQSDNILP